MKDVEKLIVIAYLNIDGVSASHAHQRIEEFNGYLESIFDDSVKTIVIPVQKTETRIEFFKADGSTTAVALETLEELKTSIIDKGF